MKCQCTLSTKRRGFLGGASSGFESCYEYMLACEPNPQALHCKHICVHPISHLSCIMCIRICSRAGAPQLAANAPSTLPSPVSPEHHLGAHVSKCFTVAAHVWVCVGVCVFSVTNVWHKLHWGQRRRCTIHFSWGDRSFTAYSTCK